MCRALTPRRPFPLPQTFLPTAPQARLTGGEVTGHRLTFPTLDRDEDADASGVPATARSNRAMRKGERKQSRSPFLILLTNSRRSHLTARWRSGRP